MLRIRQRNEYSFGSHSCIAEVSTIQPIYIRAVTCILGSHCASSRKCFSNSIGVQLHCFLFYWHSNAVQCHYYSWFFWHLCWLFSSINRLFSPYRSCDWRLRGNPFKYGAYSLFCLHHIRTEPCQYSYLFIIEKALTDHSFDNVISITT